MITKSQKRKLRKLLAETYSKPASVKRVADDVDVSVDDIDLESDIITIWDDVIDRIVSNTEKWNEFKEVLADESIADQVQSILSDANESVDANAVSDESGNGNNEAGLDRKIGGIKVPTPAPEKTERSIYKNHLLVIGIDNYSNGIESLNNAVSDARRFKDILLGKYQFEKENCTILFDEEATLININNTFNSLRSSLTENDNLIIYFSGHGWLDTISKTGYWIPSDAKSSETTTYLSNDVTKGFIKSLKVQHVVGIVDACFSGSMALRSNVEVVERYFNIESRWVMTSGLNEVVADGMPGNHSPFANSLLTHLERNTNEILGLSKLWLSIREGVVANARQTPMCQPLQDTGHMGGEFFFLTKNAKLNSIPKSSMDIDLTVKRSLVKIDIVSTKKQLKNLVSTDEMDEVFEVLKTKMSSSSSDSNTVLINQGAYNRIQREKDQGTVSFDNYKMTVARIRHAMLSVIDKIEEGDLV